MTSYSVLPTGPRTTVIATWSGEECDQSCKITTIDDPQRAARLASVLTRLSEDAWDAAAFLDTHPAIEEAIERLVEALRDSEVAIDPVSLMADEGSRHAEAWSHKDLVELFGGELPEVFGALPRTQRLTIADEIAADAAERAEALRLLPTGGDPELASSRIWQMCEVTRSLRNGEVGPLPDGAAGWIVQAWMFETSPARRWGAREQLVRIEQLVAACIASGGRATADDDPLEAHLVLPQPDEVHSRILYVRPAQKQRSKRASDPVAPMVVVESRSGSGPVGLGEVWATDDDGFANLLGEWTRAVPYLRKTDTYVDPNKWE
ncbi:hypothetical protein [Micromonospora chokoriensis]|uniref:hypothetical protein n=1 Tax=Micromonospora chokoriensis TaxID=356851 RepID=UPI0004C426A5|nr:hypothetical protein [Micromonospora chokoriensis]